MDENDLTGKGSVDHKVYTEPVRHILAAIFDKEGTLRMCRDKIPDLSHIPHIENYLRYAITIIIIQN